jgi:hypothetical protein
VRGRRLLLAVVLLALAQGCAASDPDGGGAGREAGRQAQRYQTTTGVLEGPKHGPELCLGGVKMSYPPQCEGTRITNWRWDQVEGEESAGGTTWGSYTVVGTYDGSSFTVLGAQHRLPGTPPSAAERFRDEPKPACKEPAGGWEVPDPAHRSQAHVNPAAEAARAEPDFAGVWVAYLQPMGSNVAEDPGEMVLNVAFTGDLARHRAALRRLWGGRLCVTRLQHSYRELQRIQDELDGAAGRSLGVEVLKTGLMDDKNAVGLDVVVLDQEAREAIRRRYGDAVRVTAKLTRSPSTRQGRAAARRGPRRAPCRSSRTPPQPSPSSPCPCWEEQARGGDGGGRAAASRGMRATRAPRSSATRTARLRRPQAPLEKSVEKFLTRQRLTTRQSS